MKKHIRTIKVARELSNLPIGRTWECGKYNGRFFREAFLEPALICNDKVILDMDGTLGCGSSWLDEVFGGLVRDNSDFTVEELERKLEIRRANPALQHTIWRLINPEYSAQPNELKKHGDKIFRLGCLWAMCVVVSFWSSVAVLLFGPVLISMYLAILCIGISVLAVPLIMLENRELHKLRSNSTINGTDSAHDKI